MNNYSLLDKISSFYAANKKVYRHLYRSVNKRRKPEQKSRLLIIEICLFVRASGRFLSEWTKSRPDHHCGNSIDSFAFKFSRVMPVS